MIWAKNRQPSLISLKFVKEPLRGTMEHVTGVFGKKWATLSALPQMLLHFPWETWGRTREHTPGVRGPLPLFIWSETGFFQGL